MKLFPTTVETSRKSGDGELKSDTVPPKIVKKVVKSEENVEYRTIGYNLSEKLQMFEIQDTVQCKTCREVQLVTSKNAPKYLSKQTTKKMEHEG
jgi:hypothetical protein